MANGLHRRQLISSTSAALTLSAFAGFDAKAEKPENKPFLVRRGEAHESSPLLVQGDPNAFATKVRGIDGNQTYSVFEVHTPPNRGPLLHVHPSQNELLFVLYGSIGIQCDRNRTILNVGDTFMVPANMPHAFVSLGKEESRMLITFDPPGEIERYFIDLAAVLNERPDDNKLTSVYTKYGIKVVGPQLDASSFAVSRG